MIIIIKHDNTMVQYDLIFSLAEWQRRYKGHPVFLIIKTHEKEIMWGTLYNDWNIKYAKVTYVIIVHILTEVSCATAKSRIVHLICTLYVSLAYIFHIEVLVQVRYNSSALALELCLSCTNPSICHWQAWAIQTVSFPWSLHKENLMIG